MNYWRLISRNLAYYRRPYLAVLAGVVVSTAVLTGALMVGDSVRYSLERMTDQRLGKTRVAVVPGERLFRQMLAADISRNAGVIAVPILKTNGIAVCEEKGTRINRVEIIGVSDPFKELWEERILIPGENEVVLSQNAAARLMVSVNDEVLIRITPVEKASPNAPFVPDRADPVALRLRVIAIAGDDNGGRFSLKSEQSAPLNFFVNLHQLSARLKLAGMANAILATGNNEGTLTPAELDSLTGQNWQMADAGLKISALDQPDTWDVTSGRIFLSPEQSRAIAAAIPNATQVLTYMVNSISDGVLSTPYSFVTAADSSMLHLQPGPREILINRWLAGDLDAVPGDMVNLTYWVMGPMRSLKEESARFFVKAIVPVDAVSSGRRLMPDFPGMSGAGNCRDWETGSPVDLSRIRKQDEDYWKDYRGTPKAFISLNTGQKLWANAFGNVTAFRFRAAGTELPKLSRAVMHQLHPLQNGLVFRPVYEEGRAAAGHPTDFGQLFLGLSFFILAAALLLTALLFSLHISGRISEAGVLAATGFSRSLIYRLLMGEALLVALAGTILGALSGIPCNALLLAGLNTLWSGAVQTSSLVACIRMPTLVTGALAGLITAILVMMLALRRKLRLPIALLVKGAHQPSRKTGLHRPRNIAAVALLALGTFAVVVTGANRKGENSETGRSSGTGGFLLWAESTLPVLKDLNSVEGKKSLSLEDEPVLKGVTFIPLQRLEGDDASCLNLNRVSDPPLLAVPATLFDSLGSFTFNALARDVDPAHPWRTLTQNDTPVVNGFADMTVITWGLQKQIGDTLRYTDERGNKVLVRLAGGLDNSLFQGNVLISDVRFRQLFPSVAGSRLMLVEGPAPKRDSIASRLEALLRDYGMLAVPAAEKLASFNAVENTYLTVFMMLGGLGMIIGTIGLGIILWRNTRERMAEFALLRALGHPKRRIMRRLVREYLHILMAGTGLGFGGALLVLLPNFFIPGYHFPFVWVSAILLLILGSGFAWIWAAAEKSMRREIVTDLREE